MSLTIVNAGTAGWAPGFESPEAMRETIASLEAQLASLYEEREGAAVEAPWRAPAADPWTAGAADPSAEVLALYEEKLRAGSQAAAAMRETLASFEAQLTALYEEKTRPSAEAEMVESLAAQLTELYADIERPRPEVEMVASLEAQVVALIDEKAALETAILERDAAFARAQARARDMIAALVERSLQLA